MKDTTNNGSNSLGRENEDSKNRSQVQTIFHYLKDHVATASMVANKTGIPQKNITRYKRDLEKADMLWEVKKKSCEHTGYKAWYLTTNPDEVPKRSCIQQKLF